MPRTAISYQNTIIYKIVCNDLNIKDMYVGHTTDYRRRQSEHKRSCKTNDKNFKIYIIIRSNGGWSNWCMIEIEKFPCNDGNEARARERFWYETLNSNLNSICPYRKYEEYCNDDYKDKINIYNKEYYNNNKALILEKTKEYTLKNIDKVLERRNKIITCKCGSLFALSNQSRHNKSTKHLSFLESQNL